MLLIQLKQYIICFYIRPTVDYPAVEKTFIKKNTNWGKVKRVATLKANADINKHVLYLKNTED